MQYFLQNDCHLTLIFLCFTLIFLTSKNFSCPLIKPFSLVYILLVWGEDFFSNLIRYLNLLSKIIFVFFLNITFIMLNGRLS